MVMDCGQSLLIPPLFDGTNYAYWKVCIKDFLQALGEKVRQALKLARLSLRKHRWIGMKQQSKWQISIVGP